MAAPQSSRGGSGSQSTYVPGYGYVDPNDPGTRGSVKKGPKPTRTGQESPGAQGPTPSAQQGPEIVNRDISQWRDYLEQRQAAQVTDRIGNPLGLSAEPGEGSNPFGATVDLEASWSDRRWMMFEEARQDAEGTDLGEVYAWLSRDGASDRGDLDAPRLDRMVRGMGMRSLLPGESIEDWKARIRRTNAVADNSTLGSVYRDNASRKALDAMGFEVTPEPTAGQEEGDGGYKVVSAPSAVELSNQLKATGQKNMVFIGWDSKYGAGQIMNAPMLMNREALYEFDNFPPDMKERVMEITRAYYEGMSPEFAWNEKRWRKAVDTAHNSLYEWGVYKSPFEAYEDSLIRWRAQEEEKGRTSGGGGGYYGGGYGGGSASTQRITLTSVTDAYYLLNQAMTTYLGRSPSQQELARFVKMLNAQEMANPVVATATGDTTMQEGGFNPAVFAEEFARGTEGSAEYQAATTFLDALMGALDGQTGVI